MAHYAWPLSLSPFSLPTHPPLQRAHPGQWHSGTVDRSRMPKRAFTWSNAAFLAVCSMVTRTLHASAATHVAALAPPQSKPMPHGNSQSVMPDRQDEATESLLASFHRNRYTTVLRVFEANRFGETFLLGADQDRASGPPDLQSGLSTGTVTHSPGLLRTPINARA